MNFSQIPLLITASLDAGNTPLVALRDTRERTVRHMEGLLCWLKDPAIHRIVFAKNCATRINPEVLFQAAASHGKELEFSQVNPSPRTVLQGKGYGEGDMIAQVLKRSEILRNADSFIKITGKLYAPSVADVFTGMSDGEFFVSNPLPCDHGNWMRRKLSSLYINEKGNSMLALLRRYGRIPWGLIAALPHGWIDTRWYRIRREFYKQSIIHSHRRVQDALGYTLENAVFDDLQGEKNIRLLGSPPLIIGTSGSLGCLAGKFPAEVSLEASEMAERMIFKNSRIFHNS